MDTESSTDPLEMPELGAAIRRPPFDAVTMALHWATALLVLSLFASAWLHGFLEVRQNDDAPIVIWIHRSIGVTLWVLTACRLIWRGSGAKLPPFPETMTPLHRTIVKTSEFALYALLLFQPVTGLLASLFDGHAFPLLMWDISPLPRDVPLRDTLAAIHEIGGQTLGVLALGHAAAGLFHHFVLRDDVLACMAPVVAEAPARLSRARAAERAEKPG